MGMSGGAYNSVGMVGMEGMKKPPYEISFDEKLIIFAFIGVFIAIIVGGSIAVTRTSHEYVSVKRTIVDKQIVQETVSTHGVMPLGKIWMVTNNLRRDTNHTLVLDDGTKQIVKKEEYDLYKIGDPIIIKKKKE